MDEISAFLDSAGWSDAERRPLAGDASRRRYERLHAPTGTTAILMIAPPASGEKTEPFARVADALTGLGLSAPAILAHDPSSGLMLLEDFGDGLFARLLDRDPAQTDTLYTAATDLLVDLDRADVCGLSTYDSADMGAKAALAAEWYADAGPAAVSDLSNAVETAVRPLFEDRLSLALRDYHAENLVWLPDRTGIARVGLLDFQDAQRTPRGYDLVSLVTDARRDVSSDVRERMTQRFLQATGQDTAEARHRLALLSVQRGLRILGVFARLSVGYGKPAYVKLIPRVWAYLRHDLGAPGLSDLRARVDAVLPAPTPDLLNDLEARCGTRPIS